MDQTAVSHDLARLKDCGFVLVEAEGKFRYYKLNKKTIQPLMEIIDMIDETDLMESMEKWG